MAFSAALVSAGVCGVEEARRCLAVETKPPGPWSGMTFLRIVIPLYLFDLSMISATNAFRVCREGKPVSTFPDHALAAHLGS